MNAGIIASRYAKAFLKFVQEQGAGENVYSQACILVRVMNEVPQMKDYIKDSSDVPLEGKLSLLSAALGVQVHPAISRFLKMVDAHRRLEYFPRMLLSFIEQYRIENKIMVGRLITASHNEGLCDRLEHLFHDKTGAQVHLEESVDADIIGGFVFELDGHLMDASVKGHLERIRRQLVEKNNRIV